MAYTPVVSTTVTGEIVDSGIQTVISGGTAISTKVLAGASQTCSAGGVISGTTIFSETSQGGISILAGGTGYNLVASGYTTTGRNVVVCYNGGLMNGLKLYGNSWTQVSNANTSIISNIYAYDKTRIELCGLSTLTNVTVDATGVDTELMKTNYGAHVIVFSNHSTLGNPVASNVTLRNGGSAHVYESGSIVSCTVESGGVLYLTDWNFDTQNDWTGKPRVQNGKVVGAIVKSGGIIYVGGSSAVIQNSTIQYGAKLLGLRVSQGLSRVTVYTSETTTVTYNFPAGGIWKDVVIKVGTPIERLGGMGRGTAGNPFVTQMTNLTIYEGGVMYDVSYYSTMTGKFIYGNGSSQTFTLSSGTVTGYVLGSGMNLCGDIMKVTVASAIPQLTNVVVLEGGILDGFRTGRKGDTTKRSNGTYVSSGTTVNWSFGQGSAANLYINSGCFVIQGNSTASSTDAGVTSNLTIDGGILVVANGSVNTDLKSKRNTALQIYGSSTISGAVNQDTGAVFSVLGGVASGLLIENGGFYMCSFNSGTGTLIKDSVITGSRSVASGNADYANSVMQITSGCSARNVELSSKAVLILNGAVNLDNVTMDSSVVVSWKTYDSAAVLNNTVLNGLENFQWDSATKTLSNWYYNALGTGAWSFDGTVVYKDLTLKNLAYNTFKSTAAFTADGVTLDCASSFGNNFYLYEGSKLSNFTLRGGWTSIGGATVNSATAIAIVDGVTVNCTSAAGYVATSRGGVLKNVKLILGTVYIGDGGHAGVADGVEMSGGTFYYRNGTLNSFKSTGGTFQIQNQYVSSGATYTMSGDWEMSGTTASLYNASGTIVNLNLDNLNNRLTLGGGNTIRLNIVGGSSSVLTLKGVNNNLLGVDGTGTTGVNVGTVAFDTTGVWFNENNLVAYLRNITVTTRNFACGLGQNFFNIGVTGTSAGSYTGTFNFTMGGETFSMKIGDTKSINGFQVKLLETSVSGSWLATLSVLSENSDNAAFSWTTDWSKSVNFAPKYVTTLANTSSGTIFLGAKSEGVGGNVIANAFGGYMTGGIVHSGIASSVVYGGGSGTTLATTWLRVTEGTKNTVYGGGLNDTITDGTNVYITGGATTTTAMVFGGGNGSTISVGANNVYAVNMDVGGGKHRYVYGGGNGGTINGNIGVWVYDCLVNNLYAGAGNSNVNGNVKTYLNLPAYDGVKMTGNFYGGAVAAVDSNATTGLDTTITGTIDMTLAAGDYQGIIFGGSRAWGTKAVIGGAVTMTVNAISSTNNIKMLKYGSTAWVIGGSQVQNNGVKVASAEMAGGIVMNLGAANLVNVVGGGQSTGVGADLSVTGVVINIANTTITESVFGAGYAADGGAVRVGGVTINITGASGSSTTVGGTIFAAGKTVGTGTGASVSVEGDVLVNFSGVAESISVGTVNALGKGACNVIGVKALAFTDITGTLGGTFLNFDAVKFSGDTQLAALSTSVTTSEWYFNAWNRTEAMPFVTDAASFNLLGDDRVIGLSFATTSNVSYDLMDVSDEEDFDGVTVKFFGQDGSEIGSCEFGDTIAIGTKGYVSLDIEEGMLVAKYTKGLLA